MKMTFSRWILSIFLVGIVLLGAVDSTTAQDVERGFRLQEVAGTGQVGPLAYSDGRTTIGALSVGDFVNPSFIIILVEDGVRRDLTTDTPGFAGDVDYDPERGILFTENFVSNTIYAVTAPFSKTSTGGAAQAYTPRPLLPTGSIPFAEKIYRDDELLLVGSPAGSGNGAILSINESSLAVETYAEGFNFTAGITRHPKTGHLYVGDSNFPSPGRIFRLIGDMDGSGVIDVTDPAEAEVVISAVPGPNDLVFDGGGNLYISTSSSSVLRVTDTDGDEVPDEMESFVTGLAFSGSMAFHPPSASLEPNRPGGTLYISDPFAFAPQTSTVKAVSGGRGSVEVFILHGFGAVQHLSQ